MTVEPSQGPPPPPVNRTRRLTYEEARQAEPGYEHVPGMPDLVLVGFLWKLQRHNYRWTFTTNLDNRGYPAGTEFVPVYAEVPDP